MLSDNIGELYWALEEKTQLNANVEFPAKAKISLQTGL